MTYSRSIYVDSYLFWKLMLENIKFHAHFFLVAFLIFNINECYYAFVTRMYGCVVIRINCTEIEQTGRVTVYSCIGRTACPQRE